jgi:phytoene synthase
MSTMQDAQLEAAYRYCRQLNSRHGKTFYLATALLPPAKRPPIHALYGFARYTDDIVDHPAPGRTAAARLTDLRSDLDRTLAGRRAGHPVVRALADTVHRFDIDPRHVQDFLDSMTQDLTVTRYATFADLDRYMWGSASVIGLQLLPILGVVGDVAQAEPYASHLGVAFQLTNFIRDVGEDYRRGRIYLPLQSLADFAVTPQMLAAPRTADPVKGLIAHEIERARSFYRRAEPGIELLATDSQDCVRTAFMLYSEILDEIERSGYEVLARRAAVSRIRRARVGAAAYLKAVRARR